MNAAGGLATGAGGVLIPAWELPPGVQAAVTTRRLAGVSPSPFDTGNLGSRCGDAPVNVAANRVVLRHSLGLPSEPAWLRQVHGIAVHTVVQPGDPAHDHHDDPVADAAYADRPGLVCLVQTADCLPLLICSNDGREVAAVHAGWRGLAAGVIEATLARFAAPATQLRVWLGPAIGAASYEVGEDVRAAFVAHDATAQSAFRETRPGHWLCDLYELARQRLAAAGVGNLSGGGFDTFTDPRFYSHRRSRPTGRFASLIWIDPAPSQPVPRTPLRTALAAHRRASRLMFPRLLGGAFAKLPASVQALHLRGGLQTLQGKATIRRGSHWLARLCGLVTGLPPAMQDAPLRVEIAATPRRETWLRNFDGHRMRSALWKRKGRLCERLGLVTFHFRLSVQKDALVWTVERVRALGLPLPAGWFRGVKAREFERAGRYCFEVAAALPLAGELVHYSGWLKADPVWVVDTLPDTSYQDDTRNRYDSSDDGYDDDYGDGDHRGNADDFGSADGGGDDGDGGD